MVRTRTHPIPDRSSPGSTRTMTGVKAAGHLSKSGIQNPDSTAEQPGQRKSKITVRTATEKEMDGHREQRSHDVLLRSRSITAWLQETNAQHLAIKTSRLHNLRTKTDCEIACNWLKNGHLKKETEGFVMAAQDQSECH